MVTKTQFESEREKLILGGRINPNCLKALGVLEGLMEATDDIQTHYSPYGYDHQFKEKASLLTHSKRKYKSRILDIVAQESISSYVSHDYLLSVKLALLNEMQDSRPGCEIPTLSFVSGGMNFSYLEKNVDDAMTLLEIYKSAILTEAYSKREKQLESLKKVPMEPHTPMIG